MIYVFTVEAAEYREGAAVLPKGATFTATASDPRLEAYLADRRLSHRTKRAQAAPALAVDDGVSTAAEREGREAFAVIRETASTIRRRLAQLSPAARGHALSLLARSDYAETLDLAIGDAVTVLPKGATPATLRLRVRRHLEPLVRGRAWAADYLEGCLRGLEHFEDAERAEIDDAREVLEAPDDSAGEPPAGIAGDRGGPDVDPEDEDDLAEDEDEVVGEESPDLLLADFVAIVTADDVTPKAIRDATKALGVRVPGDVSRSNVAEATLEACLAAAAKTFPALPGLVEAASSTPTGDGDLAAADLL